jgi:hypothetical protein
MRFSTPQRVRLEPDTTSVRVGAVLAALVLLLPAATTVAGAHHTFTTFYLEDDLIEIEGVIVEFQYRNPHSWVFVDGQERSGRPQIYAAEWVGTSRLERDGIRANTLRQGDSVRIWASPNRNPTDNRVHLKRIQRRDGWQWGSTTSRERR